MLSCIKMIYARERLTTSSKQIKTEKVNMLIVRAHTFLLFFFSSYFSLIQFTIWLLADRYLSKAMKTERRFVKNYFKTFQSIVKNE